MERLPLLAVLVWCLLTASTSTVSAQAAHHPHLSWSLPAATAGSPTSFSWSAGHLPAGTELAIQRPVGTAKIWRTVVRLSGSSGTASLPPEPLGSYLFRLAAVGSHHRVLAQTFHTLRVFGQVSFEKLFPSNNPSEHGVYSTPTSAFPFIKRTGQGSGVFAPKQNPCRSVHLEFVPGDLSDTFVSEYTSEQATMTVVQETQDPVSVTSPFDVAAGLTATLIPGQSWSVNLSQTGDIYNFEYYVNGSASCDSAAALEHE